MYLTHDGVLNQVLASGQAVNILGFLGHLVPASLPLWCHQPQTVLKTNECGGIPLKLYLWNLDFM